MNPNLFIWTSDWHLVSDDLEHGITNETHPTEAGNVAAYIASLQPAGVIDLGDCKDHYGLDSADEHDRYLEKVASVLPDMKRIPGNHDELIDVGPGANDFSLYDAKFGGPPYHWTLDWDAPKVRFMGIHSYVHHSADGFSGFAHVTSAEVQWLSDQIAGLPTDWQAIVCSHFPANPLFGNQIHFIDNTYTYANPHPVLTLIAANSSKVCAYLNGHRHGNMETNVLDGIKHFNGPSVAYTLGNGNGGFAPITYDPNLRTLTFDFLLGPPSAYPRITGYTPIAVQLPPFMGPPPDTLPVTKVSETATTITLGWTPVAGVGYRFSAEQQAKASHTWDPARATVKFAKGSSWYKVEALGVSADGTYTP